MRNEAVWDPLPTFQIFILHRTYAFLAPEGRPVGSKLLNKNDKAPEGRPIILLVVWVALRVRPLRGFIINNQNITTDGSPLRGWECVSPTSMKLRRAFLVAAGSSTSLWAGGFTRRLMK